MTMNFCGPIGKCVGVFAPIFLTITVLGLSGPAAGETLIEALAQAYLSNPTLRAQRAQLRATDEQISQALSGWRPTVSVGGSIGLNEVDQRTDTSSGRQSRVPKSGDITATQPLYSGGRTVADTRRAENTIEAERAGLLVVEQQVLLDAATAYTNVYRDEAVLRLNTKNEQVLRRQLEATRDRFQVGEVTRTDVSQAEARLARATADRIQAEGNLAASRANYERIIGVRPGQLSAPEQKVNLPANRDEAVAMASAENPSVVQASFTELAARDQIQVVTGELLPTVGLTGRAKKDWEAVSESSRSTSYSVTAQVSIPLYQAGGVASRVREAKETASQRRIKVEEARRQAIEDATKSWEDLQTARARIQSLKAQIRAAEIALEGVNQEALVGTRTVLDVLDAEQELLDGRVNLIKSERDEAVAAMSLQVAIGRFTGGHQGLPVELYDHRRHAEEVRRNLWGLGENLK